MLVLDYWRIKINEWEEKSLYNQDLFSLKMIKVKEGCS